MKKTGSKELGKLGATVFLVLILTPAALRLADRYGAELGLPGAPELTTGPESDDVLDATQTALEHARLEESLRRAATELAAATGFAQDSASWRERGRFLSQLFDILPLEDPSPDRNAFWIGGTQAPLAFSRSTGTGGEIRESSAVLYGSVLVGRVDKVVPSLGIGRVQTIADPGFRVKFRCGERLGILAGGRREPGEGGRPLLEARHLLPLGDLEGGQRVVTAGGDGVYPPGILIGVVVERSEQTTGDVPLVRAAIDPETLREVVVVFDTLGARLARSAYRTDERR